MASKIKVVKIGQYTVFARGVVSFFQIKENGKNVFFFWQKHYEWNYRIELDDRQYCSEANKPLDSKTHINRLFTILSIVLHKQLVKAMGL